MFRTELRQLDSPDPAGAVLVVHGDGDPSFGDAKLLAKSGLDVEKLLALWVKAVQSAGVTKVARLVIDDRVFEQEPRTHPTWPSAQLNSWYCAQVSGLDFCDNCFDIYASGSAAGTPARIEIVPAAPFLTVVNHAVTGGAGGFLVNRKSGGNDLQISGGVAPHSKSPDAVSLTMHDPAMVFGQVLADRLTRAGIAVAIVARAEEAHELPAGKLLHRIQTPLPVVLARCLKDSQNLFAESLCKRTGYAVSGGAPGSWENGAKAVTDFLVKSAGVKPGSVTIVDGSGMSRDDRLTARCLVQALTAMDRDDRLATIYRDSLSVAGQDGTLERRLHDLRGQVYGKTGYINGVSSLSGYLVVPAHESAKERVIAFSFLFNEVGDLSAVKALEDHLVRVLDADFAPVAKAR
jgi:D-alanyl-D-alanine carboxypeptidase/D-alanyl-D-alanine-endopeptidase (penicillin-binding protein 4)